MKKALLVGEYNIGYHPLEDIEAGLRKTLETKWEIDTETDYHNLTAEQLSRYSLVICYSNCYDEPVGASLENAFLDYVRSGGGILALHNGLFLFQNDRGLHSLLAGGFFLGHTPRRTVRMLPCCNPLTEGLDEPFELYEEPYCYSMVDTRDTSMLLTYEMDEHVYPAAWMRRLGEGTFIHLMPGHDIQTFNNAAFCDWLSRCAEAAAKRGLE